MKENAAHLNSQQRLVLQKHVDRAAQEAREERTAKKSKSPPLMLLVHGGPGTGKSAVIFALKKFYVDVMKFEIGHELLIGSLQASVAAMLGGETLHHIAGINPYHSQGSGSDMSQEVKQKEVSRRLAFARHLVIDEVFMLSAGFFAEAEAHIRAKVPQNSFFREAEDGSVRGWGGLNVTMFGDVRQIDPPEGIALYTVPQSFLTRPPSTALTPLAAQGLELLWGQGVELIEFLEVYRCKDPWWQQARGAEHRAGHVNVARGCGRTSNGNLSEGRVEQGCANGLPLAGLGGVQCHGCYGEHSCVLAWFGDDSAGILFEGAASLWEYELQGLGTEVAIAQAERCILGTMPKLGMCSVLAGTSESVQSLAGEGP